MQRLLPFLALLSLLLGLVLPGCGSAQARFEKGNTLYVQGNYEQALQCYREARQADPTLAGIDEKIRQTEFRVYLTRGDRAAERREWQAAERAYTEARRLEPGSPEVEACFKRLTEKRANHHFQRGQELLTAGNPFDAIGEFEQALLYQPDHPRAQEALGRARRERQDREERAEAALQDGRRAWSVGRCDEALRLFSRAMDLDPHNATAARELRDAKARYGERLAREGDAFMDRREWAKAIATYRRAQRYDPSLVHVPQWIRRAENELRAEELVHEGKQALDRGELRRAYDRLGEAWNLTADRESFRRLYDRAREGLAGEIYGQAQAAENDGRYEEAIRLYASIAEIHPRYKDADASCGRLKESLRRADEAYDVARRAEVARNLVTAEKEYRACLEAIPRFRDAEDRLVAARNDISRAKQLYDRAARAESRKELDRARVLFEECLSLVMPFRDAPQRVARIKKRLAAIAKAKELYEDGCRAQAARNLELASKLFASCLETRPGYEDATARKADVDASLKTAYQIRKRGLEAESRCALDRAEILYEECLAMATPCDDATERLEKIRRATQTLETAQRLERERRLVAALEAYENVLGDYDCIVEAEERARKLRVSCDALDDRYQALLVMQKEKKYRAALSLALEIRAQCVEFKDVDARVPLLETEVDYAEGRSFEEKKQYDEALYFFQRAAVRTPGFRDVDTRLEKCRTKE